MSSTKKNDPFAGLAVLDETGAVDLMEVGHAFIWVRQDHTVLCRATCNDVDLNFVAKISEITVDEDGTPATPELIKALCDLDRIVTTLPEKEEAKS